MALVPFKKLLRFLQKKCDKHLKIDKKDLSRVAKFVSHDGNKWKVGEQGSAPLEMFSYQSQ